MEVSEKEVETYVRPDGSCPFNLWLDSLQDHKARGRVHARIARLRLGNLGDYKAVGGGVIELRIDYGPGYRLYCGQVGNKLVIMLCGGDKNTQGEDIKKAIEYWENYKNDRKLGSQ